MFLQQAALLRPAQVAQVLVVILIFLVELVGEVASGEVVPQAYLEMVATVPQAPQPSGLAAALEAGVVARLIRAALVSVEVLMLVLFLRLVLQYIQLILLQLALVDLQLRVLMVEVGVISRELPEDSRLEAEVAAETAALAS